jgi:hypothetical protein
MIDSLVCELNGGGPPIRITHEVCPDRQCRTLTLRVRVGHPSADLGLTPSYGVWSYPHLLRKCAFSDPTVDSVPSKACDMADFIQAQESINAFCFSHCFILALDSILLSAAN